MWYLAIIMTPHLKQQERNNGAGLCVCVGGGYKHFCHISGGRGAGVENFFPKGWGEGVIKFLPNT